VRWTPRAGRRGPRPGLRVGVVALAATALLVTGCGGSAAGGAPGATGGSLADGGIDLTGETYTVGGAESAEQIVLCRMTVTAVRSVGATAVDRCGLPAAETRTALLDGRVDVAWDDTVAGWTTHLGHATPLPDPRQQYLAVRDADLEEHGIAWLPPAPFDGTASPTLRREVLDRNPAILRVFAAIAPRLTGEVVVDLESQVASQGQDPDLVATRWLQQQGFVGTI
jgi:glycine betaine/choline ABC-type transport system substrate-binding protein